MGKIRLDSRLSAVASLVRQGSVVADIGTDHAYLLAYLLQEGKIKNGIAADLRKGPLENARKTLVDCGLIENVSLVLSDGLDKIKRGDCNDIAIAGMGGILIKEILERTPWVYDEDVHIVAQPMTHGEVLRKFFIENGFVIDKELAATDGKRHYCIISATYNGEKRVAENWYTYVGELINNNDEISEMYISKIILTLEKKLDAIKKAGVDDNDNIEETIALIKQKFSEVKNG